MPEKKAAKKTAKKAAKKPAPKSPPSTQAADQVDEQLARYRSMRDFAITAEPSGTPKSKTGQAPELHFCIQKHAASHLHYDFRLEWNGVLKSWACAKGPSFVVADKRLAVQVEDHPIEYGGFEGIIPAGQYGGGTVMLWDQGTWAPQEGHTDVEAGLREGNLKFTLDGTKMHGKWALIRMGGKAAQEKKPNWLLIKEHDDFERPPDAPAITDEAPKSVITGRTMDQIAANQDHVWNSKESAKPGQAWHRQEPSSSPQKPETPPTQPAPPSNPTLPKLPEEHQPSFIKPQLATEATGPPETPGWLHELKLDGYRIQARKEGAKVQLLTRSGLDWTARIPSIAQEIARLPTRSLTLDGEVVVLAPDGTTNFAQLQAAFQDGARNPLTYFAFDLLHLEGRNPRALPLIERKRLLAPLLASADPSLLQLSEHLETNGVEMFHKACDLHAEGILSKRASAPYTEGRSTSWLKSKCLHEQEFVVAGYTLPGKGKAGGPGLGALLLGFYDDHQNLIYAGRTGTGFTQKSSAAIRKQLEALETPKPAFKTLTSDARRGALWVRPDLVAQVRFATWTAEDQLRQAAFLGLREDKAPTEVRRERAAPTPKSDKHPLRPTALGSSPAQTSRVPHSSQKHRDEWEVNSKLHQTAPIRLTHPAKIIDISTALTKQQLADFYWAVATRMLPHIADRPLSLVRCPEGSEKPCFFQKHTNTTLPPGVLSIDVPDKKTGKPEPYITLNTPEALAGLAQMGVLEIHPWGSRNDSLELPDRLIFDLDPDESLSWSTLTQAAQDVRKRLKALGLESWVKTTGGKGLHVVLPIEPTQQWPQIKQWCHTFVLQMERANPALYLTKMSKAARSGKIYLDYLRNERGATAVAPYSPRARKGMGVAVPIAWSELATPTRPLFQVATFPAWAARLKKDPWAAMPRTKQTLPAL